MRNGRKDESREMQLGTESLVSTGDGGVPNSGGDIRVAGRVSENRQRDEQPGTIPGSSIDGFSKTGHAKRNILARIEADTRRGPEYDSDAAERWPVIQECLSCTLTEKGLPRAGGEIKTVAMGCNYRTSLVMPEEGVQVSVVHNALSKAWDALEHVLCLEPVPWVECSEFATRRAKQRGKKKEEKKVD